VPASEASGGWLPLHQKLTLTTQLDTFYAGSENRLYDLKGELSGEEGATGFTWKTAHLTARSAPLVPSPEIKQRDGTLTLRLTPLNEGGQKWDLVAGNGGYLLKALGLFPNIRRGRLVLSATQKKPQSPFIGTLTLDDFIVAKTPFLTSLFMTLASPTSFLTLFSGGKVTFQRFKSDFSWHNNVLTIKRAIFKSINSGVSLRGTFNAATDTFNLRGNLIPAYLVNRFLSAIPLLGDLITGGKDDGLFATRFYVTGSSEKPSLSANPINMFAPGFLKNLFRGLDDDEKKAEEKAEQEENEIDKELLKQLCTPPAPAVLPQVP
jgi:hypothetical protein